MTSPFRFKHPFPPQASSSNPSTPSTQLSARNFVLSHGYSTAPASSLSSASQIDDDIEDPYEHAALPRKRKRYSSFHDISSDGEDDFSSLQPGPALGTPITKRPPVILPQPNPESPTIELSPSRRQPFQPNGLAAYTAKIIHEHTAASSVALPRFDQEDVIIITQSKIAEGGIGWICSTQGTINVLLLKPKGLSTTKQVSKGDCISISNPVKFDTIWICSSWQHKPV